MNRTITLLIIIILLVSQVNSIQEEKGTQTTEVEEGKVLGKLEYKEGNTLEVENYKVNLASGETKIIEERGGVIIIILKGEGNVEVKGHPPINNVRDVIIKVKDNQVQYAEFTSTTGGLYKFINPKDPKGESTIVAKENSQVIYDPLNNIISGKGLKSYIYQSEEQDIVINLGEGGFILKFKDQDIKNIVELKLPAKSTYNDNINYLSYSSEENFNVYLDGRSIEKLENAISILGETIFAKGNVNIENKKFGIIYNGASNEVYTEYNSLYQVFDIKYGDARISNSFQEIVFEDGKIYLKTKDLDQTKGETFSFKYSKDGKEENSYYTIVNEEGQLITFGGTKDNLISLLTINKFLQEFPLKEKLPINEIRVDSEIQKELQDTLNDIKSKKARGEKIPQELIEKKDKLEYLNLKTKIDDLIKSNKNKDAIIILQEFLGKDRPKEVEAIIKLQLSELYTNLNPEVSNRNLEEAKQIYLELQKKEDLSEDVTLKLGQIFLKENDVPRAISEFRRLIESKNPITKSKALLGIANAQLQNNEIEAALLNFKKAIILNPDDEIAKQALSEIKSNIYETIIKGISKEQKELFENFEEKWGIERTRDNLLSDIRQIMGNTFNIFVATGGAVEASLKKLEKEEVQSTIQLGITVLERLERRGYDLERFSKLNFDERKKIISEALNLKYTSEDEVKDLFLNLEAREREALKDFFGPTTPIEKLLLNPDLRRRLLKELKGEEYADADAATLSMALSTITAQNNWDVVLTISGGDISKAQQLSVSKDLPKIAQFKFKTGEGYIDPENLKISWKDKVSSHLNLWLPITFLGPSATVKGIPLILHAGKLIGYIPGGTKATEITATLKEELSLSNMFASGFAQEQLPTLSKVGHFVAQEVVETSIGFVTQSQVAEILASYAPYISEASSKKILAKLGKILVMHDENLPAIDFASKEDIHKFLEEFKGREIGENLYEINGKRFTATINDILPDLIAGQKVRASVELFQKGSLVQATKSSLQWSEKLEPIILKDPKGNEVRILLPSLGERLRTLKRIDMIGGRPIEMYGIGKASSKVVEPGIVEISVSKILLPKKEEIIFFDRDYLTTKELFNLKTSIRDLEVRLPMLENSLKIIHSRLRKADLKPLGFEGKAFDELLPQEKEKLFETLRLSDKPEIKSFKEKYRISFGALYDLHYGTKKVIDSLKDVQSKFDVNFERSFGLPKPIEELSTEELLTLKEKFSGIKMLSMELQVAPRTNSPIDYHDHPVSKSVFLTGSNNLDRKLGNIFELRLHGGKVTEVTPEKLRNLIIEAAKESKQKVEETNLDTVVEEVIKNLNEQTVFPTVEDIESFTNKVLRTNKLDIKIKLKEGKFMRLSSKRFRESLDEIKKIAPQELKRSLAESEKSLKEVEKKIEAELKPTSRKPPSRLAFDILKREELKLGIKQLKAKSLLDKLSKGEKLELNDIADPSLVLPSPLDKESVVQGGMWFRIPETGQELKISLVGSLGGTATIVQFKDDPKIYTIRDIANRRIITEELISEVLKE